MGKINVRYLFIEEARTGGVVKNGDYGNKGLKNTSGFRLAKHLRWGSKGCGALGYPGQANFFNTLCQK